MAPRWIVRLLAAVVRPSDQDEVIGDLEELHRRRHARWGAAPAYVTTTCEGVWLLLRHSLMTAGGGTWAVSSVELRLAWRMLWKQPVVTLTSVVALGVGIGIAAGGISVFQQVLFSELPFDDADRWVVIETYTAETRQRTPLELERARLFRTEASSFEYIGGFETRDLNLVHDNGEVERIRGSRVSPATFRRLPYVPLVGRLLTPDDGGPGSSPVALIGESLWMRSLARSPDAVGATLNINGVLHEVVGVLPDHAEYPSQGEVWLPLDEETLGAETERGPVAGTRSVAILADGATVERATAELQRLSDQFAAEGRAAEPQFHRITRMTETIASPQTYVGSVVASSILVALLLVIASNVANLIVARTSRRAGELAVRSALGASRRRLVTQLFVEAMAIGAIAAIPGVLAAAGILSLYDRVLDELPFWIHLSLRPSTAVVVVALALGASAVVGLLPALRATRSDPADSLRSLRHGGRLGVGRLGEVMIAAEVALSVAMIGTAILYAQGFRSYVDPSFDLPDERVLTARVRVDLDEGDLVPGGAATIGDSIHQIARSLRRSLGMLPGVVATGVSSAPPRLSPYPEEIEIDGRTGRASVPVVYQGPGFFDVLEVDVTHGRDFDERDLAPRAPPVAIVNRAFAVEHFGTTRVLGRGIRLAEHDEQVAGPWREIVGVVPDVMEVATPTGAAGVYVPFASMRSFTVGIRVASDPVALAGRLRRAAFDLDPNLNVSEVVRLDRVGAENRIALGAMSSALLGVGIITLLLSLAGIYAIVSLVVSRRTREIGVRVALGAARSSILSSILRRSALLVGAGAIAGALAGWYLSRAQLFVFVVPEANAGLFPLLVVLMVASAAAACWVPARRALSIEPVEALRVD